MYTHIHTCACVRIHFLIVKLWKLVLTSEQHQTCPQGILRQELVSGAVETVPERGRQELEGHVHLQGVRQVYGDRHQDLHRLSQAEGEGEARPRSGLYLGSQGGSEMHGRWQRNYSFRSREMKGERYGGKEEGEQRDGMKKHGDTCVVE